MMDYLKEQAVNPKWDEMPPVHKPNPHDWRKYVSDPVRALWSTFTGDQQLALVQNFQEIADREEWE